jgi:hypothetical protein
MEDGRREWDRTPRVATQRHRSWRQQRAEQGIGEAVALDKGDTPATHPPPRTIKRITRQHKKTKEIIKENKDTHTHIKLPPLFCWLFSRLVS